MNRRRPGRGPKIPNEVRQLIISQAIYDSKTMPRRALAIRLQELIERMGEVSPTEDTLARMISEARNKQPNELEKPWSIGACSQYNIPSDIIPILIKIQKLKVVEDKEGSLGEITIREARWIARLYPAVEPLISKSAFDDDRKLLWLLFIADNYAQRERVSEQMNEQYPNTSDLDVLYFASEDFLSNDALVSWWDAIPPEYQQNILDAIEEERTITHEDIKQHKGRPLSSEETKMIADCFDIVKSGGLVALREFVNQSSLAKENGMMHIITSILYSKAVSGGIK
jgi:hypothetical protein